jgi:hypothetical protein
MGGPWRHPTGSSLIRVDDWSRWLRVEYGREDWPSYSVRKWFWGAE